MGGAGYYQLEAQVAITVNESDTNAISILSVYADPNTVRITYPNNIVNAGLNIFIITTTFSLSDGERIYIQIFNATTFTATVNTPNVTFFSIHRLSS